MPAVPSGLVGLCMARLNFETLGYYHASLRDEHEILVAMGFQTCCTADFQSAGCNCLVASADWKSAIQQAGSLRYALPLAKRYEMSGLRKAHSERDPL